MPKPFIDAKPFIIALGVLAVLPLSSLPTQAQLLDQLKGATGGGAGGSGAGGLGANGLGVGASSVNQASPSNIAGLLQYCVQNNYLSGGSASSVKDSLVSKVTGSHGGSSSDSQFKAGSNGTLESGGGQSFSLGGGGIKQQATKQVCDLVLQHAKSLI